MKKQFYTIAALLIMGVTANAQVGIGTTTPDASSMLDITSTSKGFLAPRLTTSQRTVITNPATGLSIYNLTTNRIEVNIGTPAVPNWQPAGGTTVANNIYTNDGSLVSNRTLDALGYTLRFNNTGALAGSTMFRLLPATGTKGFSMGAGGLFEIDSPGVFGGRVAVLENGNVGIGTNGTPNAKLDIVGTEVRLKAGSGASYYSAVNSDGTSEVRLQNNNGAGAVGTYSNQNFEVLTNSLSRVMVTNTGNVGIGTSSPLQKLHLVDATTPLRVEATATNGEAGIYYGRTATGTAWVAGNGVHNIAGFNFYSGVSADVMTLLDNGNVGIGTTTPSSKLHVNGVITATKIQGPSDSRFKKNIKPIENALEKVMKLGGYTYDWKDASEFPNQTLGKGHDMGVIAQEVEKQFPEAVSTNAEGFKAVSYTELVPALIEAIKAQQIQAQAQQAQIEVLKAEVAKLKK